MATGYPREDQWIWLKKLLAMKDKDMPVVVFCHDCGPDTHTFMLGDVDMKQHGLLAWIFGHDHSPLHIVRSGVHSICTGRPDSGGIDSSPAHLRLTTVANKQVSSKLLYREFPKDEADTPVWKTRLSGHITFCEPVDNGNHLLVAAGKDSLPAKNAVYTGGFNKLQKLDAATGETLLEGDLGVVAEKMGAPRVESDGQCNVSGAPLVDGDVLYCPTASAGVLAVDKNTLQVLRRFPCGTAALLTAPYVMKGCQTVEATPIVRGETLIFAADDGKVYFYDKNTAQLQKTICLPGVPLVTPVLEETAMYTADFEGNVCKFKL